MSTEHARCFADIPLISIDGIFSRGHERSTTFAKRFNIERPSESIHQLWESTHSNLLVIAVSELSLFNIVQQAFRYPWTILIEKPVGLSLAEAEEISRLASQTSTRAFAALNRRHLSSTQSLVSHLTHCNLSRIVHVIDQQDPAKALSIGKDPYLVQQWMYANSIHLVDYFTLLCRGRPESIDHIYGNPEKIESLLSIIHYDSGDKGLYESYWNRPGPWSVSISTNDSYYQLAPLEHLQIRTSDSRDIAKYPLSAYDVKYKPGFYSQALQLINAHQGLAHSLPSLEDALSTIRLISKLYRHS